jgi:hypothetical protein
MLTYGMPLRFAVACVSKTQLEAKRRLMDRACSRCTMKGRHPVADGGARLSRLSLVRPRVSQSGSVPLNPEGK